MTDKVEAFERWFEEFDKQNHYPYMLARAAWDAALAQQPAAPSAPVGVEAVDEAVWNEALELPEGFRVAEHLPGIWEYQFDIEDEADEDSDRKVSGTSWNHPALAAIAAWSHAYAALAQQPAAAGVSVDVVREYLDARACYEDATRKPNSHAPAPTLKHGDPVVLRLREARIALDAAIEKAKQPAAEPRSTHRAWRYIGENIHSLPCCCASTNDHAFGHEQAFGPEQPAAVDEAAIRYALDHARDLDDGVARVVAAIAAQQPAAENDDAEQLAYCKYDWRKVCKAIRGDDEHMDPDEVVAWIEERKQPAAVDDVVTALESGFTLERCQPSTHLTAQANAERAWKVGRSLFPFCDWKGTGCWFGATPQEAISRAKAALAAQPGNLYVEDGDTEPHYDH